MVRHTFLAVDEPYFRHVDGEGGIAPRLGYEVEVHLVDGHEQLVYRDRQHGVYVREWPRPGDTVAPAPHKPWCAQQHDIDDGDDLPCKSPEDGMSVGPTWTDPEGHEARAIFSTQLVYDPQFPTQSGLQIWIAGPTAIQFGGDFGRLLLNDPEEAYEVAHMILDREHQWKFFEDDGFFWELNPEQRAH
jgi:hypothetical protein